MGADQWRGESSDGKSRTREHAAPRRPAERREHVDQRETEGLKKKQQQISVRIITFPGTVFNFV